MTSHAKTADNARQPQTWMRRARDVVAFALDQGASQQAMLSVLGVTPAQLDESDSRLPLTRLYSLIEHAAAATAPKHFGLRYARAFNIDCFDAIGFLMMTSATLGEAFERGFRYQRVWAEGEHFELSNSSSSSMKLRYRAYGPPREAHRLCTEFAFVDLGVNAGTLCGKRMPLQEVRFRHHGPLEASDYEEIFQCPVKLGSPTNEITFAAEALHWPLPDANAAMCSYFERHSNNALAQLTQHNAIAEHVRQAIARQLGHQLPSLGGFAKQLHMSGRTLQRRLREEGHTLHGLIDDVRREHAAALLDQPIAIAEISYLLGYSEPSAFHRAFKRWTGATPDAYRTSNTNP